MSNVSLYTDMLLKFMHCQFKGLKWQDNVKTLSFINWSTHTSHIWLWKSNYWISETMGINLTK